MPLTDRWHLWVTVVSLIVGVAFAFATPRRRFTAARWPLWVALAAVASFVVNVTLARQRGVPEPRVHDEFSYLLAADTFAHGRLTNPTPPAWPALQTFHVLLRPTYASKYPPGQGLCLALGQVTTGLPIVGAWFAAAALTAAAGWAAAGFSRGWGVAVAAVVAVHPQVVEWSQTYWGGSVAATGGALLLGAWVRLARRGVPWTWRDAIALGIGLGVLANSRPYEGLAAAVPVIGHLLLRRPRVVAASLVALGPILVFTGIYDDRVTGSPWSLPYLVYEHQYAAAPPLLFGTPRSVPAGTPAEMRSYAEQIELPHFDGQRTLRGWLTTAGQKLAFLAVTALPSPWLWIVALSVPWAVATDRRLWVPGAVLLATLAATLASNWTRTQYVAPATAAGLIVVAAAAAKWTSRLARAVVVAAVVCTALLPFGPVTATGQFQRGQLAASLAREPGKQLVLVRYLPGARPDDEWVYNDADPPSAKVVWARDDGDAGPVRAAYPGRTVWHLDVSAASVAVHRE
jgi:hypothetical protein